MSLAFAKSSMSCCRHHRFSCMHAVALSDPPVYSCVSGKEQEPECVEGSVAFEARTDFSRCIAPFFIDARFLVLFPFCSLVGSIPGGV